MFAWEGERTDDLKTIKIVAHVQSYFPPHKIIIIKKLAQQPRLSVSINVLSLAQLRYLHALPHACTHLFYSDSALRY